MEKISTKELAKAVQLASELHNNSFDTKSGRHSLSHNQSACQGCQGAGIAIEWAPVVTFMLIGTWNEAVEWAEAY